MKKNLFTIAAGVAFVSAVSCSVEEKNLVPETDLRVPMEFTAGIGTKTQLYPDHSVVWSEGDVISIFDGEYNNDFTINGEGGAASATFTGKALPDAAAYYALYPHSADAKLDGTVISSTLPSEQTVTAEATFATMVNPSVAVAAENSLTFKNIASILQVDVWNLAEGQKVTGISAKADKSLAGAYTVDLSASEPAAVASGSENTGVSLAGEIADLNGDNQYTYSMVVFPGTYNDLTVTVTYSDGSKSTFTASSAVDMPVSDGRTISIDASQAEAPAEKNLYEKFMDGEDIVIAGKTYNKETYGEATLIDTDYTISSADKNVYFVEQDATLNLNTSTGIRKLIIIGNDSEKRGLMNIKSQVPLNQGAGNTDGTFVIYNMDVDASTVSSNYVFAQNRDGAYGYVGIIESSLKMPSGKQFSYVSSNARSYAEIVFENSEIEIPGATQIMLFSFGPSTAGYGDFIFRNNIIYSEGGVSDFRIYNGTATSLDSFTFENNTVINLWAKTNGCVLYNSLDKISVTKNLFWTDMETTNYAFFHPTDTDADQGIPYTGNPTGTLLDDNYVYQNSNETNWQWLYGGVNRVDQSGFTAIKEARKITVDPLSVKDFENCVFTQIPEYAEYGAQR